MDPAIISAIASGAVEAIVKELTAGAIGGAKSVYGWLKERLSGAGGPEAIAELEQAPTDADNQAVLAGHLRKLLKASPALADELKTLLPAQAQASITQIANVSGAGARVAQVTGSGNKVDLG
jgi:hypothetical protein